MEGLEFPGSDEELCVAADAMRGIGSGAGNMISRKITGLSSTNSEPTLIEWGCHKLSIKLWPFCSVRTIFIEDRLVRGTREKAVNTDRVSIERRLMLGITLDVWAKVVTGITKDARRAA